MPKIKTNKSVKKRFSVTKKGKVKRAQANRRHLLGGKTSGRKRRLRQPAIVGNSLERDTIKKMIPYDM